MFNKLSNKKPERHITYEIELRQTMWTSWYYSVSRLIDGKLSSSVGYAGWFWNQRYALVEAIDCMYEMANAEEIDPADFHIVVDKYPIQLDRNNPRDEEALAAIRRMSADMQGIKEH